MAPFGASRAGLMSVAEDDIPDSVVDNFEDDPEGIYESGQTLNDYYTFGDQADFARTQSNVAEGSFAVELVTNNGREAMWSNPGDGLNNYPEHGDSLRVLLRGPGDDPEPGPIFNVEDSASPGGYIMRLRVFPGEIELIKVNDFSTSDWADSSSNFNTLDTTSVSVSSDTWYWAEVTPSWSGDNNISATIYEFDNGSRGSSLGTVSATDSTYEDNQGVGVHSGSSQDTGTIVDGIEVI